MWNMTLLLIAITSAPVFATGESRTMYVQAIKTEVRSEPRVNAKPVLVLKRGDEVLVSEPEGLWFRAKVGANEGWVSKLFLSAHPPVGKADLDKDIPSSLEKANRRRAPSYAVSASARGLMIGDRARHGRELYRLDPEALERLENFELPAQALERFRAEAGLNP